MGSGLRSERVWDIIVNEHETLAHRGYADREGERSERDGTGRIHHR